LNKLNRRPLFPFGQIQHRVFHLELHYKAVSTSGTRTLPVGYTSTQMAAILFTEPNAQLRHLHFHSSTANGFQFNMLLL
jgi:hypothetical protein